ncbi:hypothetical protein PENTCL1PPCAC_15875, partial [Pristionchus entomophagus]
CPHCTYSVAVAHALKEHVKLHGIDSASTDEGVNEKETVEAPKPLKRPAARIAVPRNHQSKEIPP